MTSGKRPARLRANDYPALQDFLRGYLHQDYVAEYGSAEKAMAAFKADAAPADLAVLCAEWKRFWSVAEGQPLPLLQRFLCDGLGSGWQPESVEEAAALFAALSEKKSD